MGIQSIRPFIGAQNFELSCAFYRELGFSEEKLEEKLKVYKLETSRFIYKMPT